MVLMSRMMRASRDTAMEISDFYMERMNLQIISHFDTTVDIKLAQVESIIKTMPPEGIGLSNIRAVLETVSGTVEKTVSEGVYKLKLLFLLR